MPVLPSVPFSQLKATRSFSGGGAIPGARVLLYNPAAGKAVQTTVADGSGNYFFNNIDQDISLQVITASNDNFTCSWTSEVLKPAKNLSWYQLDVAQNSTSVIGINISGLSNLPPQFLSVSARVIDYIPFSYRLEPQGPGHGAEIDLQLGEYTNYGTFAITGFIIKSFGKGYVNEPLLKLSGVTRSVQSGYPYRVTDGFIRIGFDAQGDGIFVNPVGYIPGVIGLTNINDTWYIDTKMPEGDDQTDTLNTFSCRTASITTQEDLITSLNFYYGNDSALWNTSNNSNQGRVKMANQVPNLTTVQTPSTCGLTNAQAQALFNQTTELWTEHWWPMSQTALEGAIYGVYLAIIEGQDTQDPSILGTPVNVVTGSPANRQENSAFAAVNAGVITSAELQYLKGWLAMETQVKPFVNRLGGDWLTYMLANYPSVNQIYRDVNFVLGQSLLYLHNAAQSFHRQGTDGLSASFIKELQDVYAQSPGINDASAGQGIERVRTILYKMQTATGKNFITGLITQSGTGERYRWNFSGNTLTRDLIP